MVTAPPLAETSVQSESVSALQAELEKAQWDNVQLRRELLRWKLLARQHEDQLREIQSNPSWRILSVVRILPELKHRWKLLLLVAALGLVTLPFWPVLTLLILFPAGRDLVWRTLWKIRPLRDLMGFIRQKIVRHTEVFTPSVYDRPVNVVSPAEGGMTGERAHWLLLQQLCPQRRAMLQDYGLTTTPLVRDDESPDLLSLSRAEMSVLRVSTNGQATAICGSAGSP